ncbi:MAG: alpha/beta hydrolase [Candidatus Pacebacteria bacterium]|nr:alpha/beta hydrolase [Candidatus Paceibacterota bacterium]
MENKPQVIFIHGGDAIRDPEKLYQLLRARSFNPYEQKKKWRDALIENIGGNYECHTLSMPNAFWADYEAWKIWFEKMIPYMHDGIILVGHSLGGGFLLRYLGENTLLVRVAQLHLLAPVVLDLEDCDGFLIDSCSWAGFKTAIDAVHVWHSTDDNFVPIAHSEKLLELYPSATLHRFTDRGHFLTESFPELEAVITTT